VSHSPLHSALILNVYLHLWGKTTLLSKKNTFVSRFSIGWAQAPKQEGKVGKKWYKVSFVSFCNSESRHPDAGFFV
jgi:hypothetical protein